MHRDWICIRFHVALISVSYAGIPYSFCTVVVAAVVAAVDAAVPQLPSAAVVTGVAVGKNVWLSKAGLGWGRGLGSLVCQNGLPSAGLVVDADSSWNDCVWTQ